MKHAKTLAFLLALLMLAALLPTAALAASGEASGEAPSSDRAYIEETLNLANNPDQEWTYNAANDAWVLSVVSAVAYPEIENKQGVSVAVPGAFVAGIDRNGDGMADVSADVASEPVLGSLVIDYDAKLTNANGQTYTAATAPIVFTTGAAGYGSATNSKASAAYCAYGYISMTCGNRGKQDAVSDEMGEVLYYTGDAPACLCDQKAAARFVKYNILLGNLPGCVDYLVTTGGSGGAAHASMYAATSNNPDFYDYQIEAGAVGVYQNADGSYDTTVTVNGKPVSISDGAWGCVAYSAITPLYQADAGQAFEYFMDPTFEFGSAFQKKLAEFLSESYMEYLNGQQLSVSEEKVGFDLDGDGKLNSTVAITIEYDPAKYPETNGYGGSFLDLYLCEFTANLQAYLDDLGYASDWTWFGADGKALSDADVAAMSLADKQTAFLEGRYAKSGRTMGGPPGSSGEPGMDSSNYETFEELVAAYTEDIAGVTAGDRFGKNTVELYDPIRYIGAEGTEAPCWTRIVMGGTEGDICMVCSLNMELKWLASGTDAVIEWQWDGGHVPSEILGDSFALYLDQMVGKYVSGVESAKASAEPVTANGTAEEATGKVIADWVNADDLSAVSFTLADVLAYRNAGASKSVPGFDVIDYGQEDYVFGSAEQDARHWDHFVLDILTDPACAAELAPLFNSGLTGDELPDGDASGEPSGEAASVEGVYTFAETNVFGLENNWTLTLNADGSYALNEVNLVAGDATYTGTYTADGSTVTCSAMNEAGPGYYDWANPAGFTVTVSGSGFTPAV